MATIFRSPLFTPRGSPSVSRVPHTAQADVWQNLRLTLRAPVAANPQHNYDFPNPQVRLFPLEGRTYTDPSEFWLLKDKFFGAAGEPPSPFNQPNPIGYPFPLENRTQFDTFYRTGQERFFEGPGQTQTYDYPNPRVRPFPIENLTLTDSGLALTTVVAQAPFSQTDWPNPRGPQFAIDNRTETDPSEVWLLKDQFFGGAGQPPVQTDWPNPGIAARMIDLRTWTQTHVLDTLAPITARPFTQTEWPNPTLKPWTPEFRTLADPSEFWLLKDTFFGGPGQPTSPHDWPNPTLKVWTPEGRTWTDGPQPQPVIPIFGLTAPNPTLKRPDLRLWSWAFTAGSYLFLRKPFNQQDWPLPLRRDRYAFIRNFSEPDQLVRGNFISFGATDDTDATDVFSGYRAVPILTTGFLFDPAIFDPDLFDDGLTRRGNAYKAVSIDPVRDADDTGDD